MTRARHLDTSAVSPSDRWFDAFEQAVTERFTHYFAEPDRWGFLVDRVGLTISAGDQRGAPGVTVGLPPVYGERSPVLLADSLLERLRQMAEESGFLPARP